MPDNNFIQLPSDSVGKKTRTVSSVIGTVDNGNQLLHAGVVHITDNDGSVIGLATGGQSSSIISAIENPSDRDLIERQTVLLELISLKLDCLQRDEITEDDLE